jgi:hypothetical protein
MSGKGSAPRPMPDYEKYSDNYDLIFRKKKNEPVQDSSSTERTLAQVGDSGETQETKDSK